MKRNQRNAQLQVTKELVGVFEEANARGNYALMDNIINDFAYGDEKGLTPNPLQAFILLKGKVRGLERGDRELDSTLCFMAELIGDEDVNPGNRTLVQSLYTNDSGIDLIERIANGDFKTPDENGRDFSQGFDEFEPEEEARIIAYARHAIAEFKRNPPAPDELSR